MSVTKRLARDPTAEMIDAAIDARIHMLTHRECRELWREMHDAAPDLADGPTSKAAILQDQLEMECRKRAVLAQKIEEALEASNRGMSAGVMATILRGYDIDA